MKKRFEKLTGTVLFALMTNLTSESIAADNKTPLNWLNQSHQEIIPIESAEMPSLQKVLLPNKNILGEYTIVSLSPENLAKELLTYNYPLEIIPIFQGVLDVMTLVEKYGVSNINIRFGLFRGIATLYTYDYTVLHCKTAYNVEGKECSLAAVLRINIRPTGQVESTQFYSN